MATQVKQGQLITSVAAETEITVNGGPLSGTEVFLYVVTGTFQYTVAPIEAGPAIADAAYESVTTARKVTVPTGYSLRLKGSATIGITW